MSSTQGTASRARRERSGLALLGIAGGVVAWLGWFEIASALGFPTMGPAAMLNRVFAPGSDPGYWVGWAVLAVGLLASVGLYSLAAVRGWLRPGPLSGMLFGVAAWAVAGLILMVIIGHVSQPPPAPPPPPGPPLPTQPDPMHATFMMLHLGWAAPVEALVAWLLLGAVVGATSIPSGGGSGSGAFLRPRVSPATGVLALATALTLAGWISVSHPGADPAAAQTGVRTRVLATGKVKALPTGASFVSVIALPQAPGATVGPHAHVPGFAYVLRGQQILSSPVAPAAELNAGQAGFTAGLAVHAHENRKGRVPAAALAAGLPAIGLVLSGLSLRTFASRRATMALLAVLLIATGAVAVRNPWANDWFFISVRPGAARGGAMPRPNASRVFESPDLKGVPTGPYTETLRLLTVPAGGATRVQQEPGPEVLLVLSGRAEVRLGGGSPLSLGRSQSVLAQRGASVQISNPGGGDLNVLSFSVVPSGGST